MKRLRFCMVPIAAMLFVLLAMSFAWAKVVDFRANITPTVVKTGENAYLVVELLNDQGQVDPFGYQEVVNLQVQVASLLSNELKIGSSNNATHTVDAKDKGVVLATIDYKDVQPGTDTISVTLKERIVNPDTGNEYWHVIKTQTFNVTIQQAQNTAKSVEVTDISLPQAPVEDEASSGNYHNQKCSNPKGGCTVEAGNSFIINLKACKEQPYNGTCTKVSTQNSNVYVYLVGAGSEEGNLATSSDVYELNGTFKNGVASITVPEGTVTKAGKYKIYITTDGKKNRVTGQNEAIEQDNYYVLVSPRQATKVKVEVNAATADQTGKAWCWKNSDGKSKYHSSKVVAKLLDQYDNVADKVTGIGDSDKVTVKIKYNNTDVAELDLKKNSVTNSTYLDCKATSSDFGSLDEGDRVEKSFTVTLDKNDLGVEQVNTSLPVNVYADYIVLNGTAFDDDNFLATASGLMNDVDITNIISSAGNSTGDSLSGTELLNSFKYDDNITPLTFTFLDYGFLGINEQTLQVKSNNNGTIEAGNLEINNLQVPGILGALSNNNNNLICAWLEDKEKYLPKTCTEINAAPLVAMAKKKDIAIYQIKSFRYFPNGTSEGQVEWHEVTGDINLSGSSDNGIVLTLRDFNATADDDNVTKLYGVALLHDNNATVNATEKFPEYTARVVDSSGNFANSTALTVSCLHTTPITGPADIHSGNKTYIKWSDTTVTEDTCTFKAGSLTKQVTVHLNWSAGPDHVNIDAPSDYVLTTSKAPLVISLRNADDTEYGDDPGNYTIRISDPSLVRVYNSTDMNNTTEIEDGEDIDWNNDGKATIFVQTLATTGDVTITVKNSAGTVTGSKTLHIVEKASDIPVTVGSVTTSPASLSLMQQEEGTITATVKDTGGNPVSGIEVSAESDNTDIATVSPATCTTDANGQCTITVTAGTTQGTAHLTLTAQGKSALVDVEVTQEQAQCDADHLNLCTTEEDCTAAGGYWYDDACHETPQEQPEQPQPVPTKPTQQQITDVSTAPVNLGEVASGTGDTMEVTVNFPPYENPVNIYVGILLPTGDLYVLQSDNTFTTQLVPYAQNVTDAVSATVFEPFEVCQTTPFGTTALIPEGTYSVYTLVLPAGTDIMTTNWSSDPYELLYYSFDVNCSD